MRSSSSNESLTAHIEQLSLEEGIAARLQQLQQIKIMLSMQQPPQGGVSVDDLQALFGSLESQNPEEVSLACDIIDVTLSTMDPQKVLNEMSSFLLSGLQHYDYHVCELVLRQLTRMVKSSPTISNSLIESPEIIEQSVALLGSDEISTATLASQFLSYFARNHDACLLLLSPNKTVLSKFAQVMKVSDAVRFRVYELVCKIGVQSQYNLNICNNSGIMREFLNELNGNDILTKIACVSMLGDFASVCSEAFNFLVQCGIISEINKSLKNDEQGPFDALYHAELMKFTGKICLSSGVPLVIEHFSGFIQLLLDMSANLRQLDHNLQVVAISTLGVVARSYPGKMMLTRSEYKRSMNAAVQEICKTCTNSDDRLKVAAIDMLTCLFDHSKVEEENRVLISHSISQFYNLLAPSSGTQHPIQFIFNLLKFPVPDVKIATYKLLCSLCTCEWGLQSMNSYGSFVETITSRTSLDDDNETNQSKYDFIFKLQNTEHCARIFGNPAYLQFRTYVTNGVYYSQVRPQVAIEES